jgi:hypothetical protein
MFSNLLLEFYSDWGTLQLAAHSIFPCLFQALQRMAAENDNRVICPRTKEMYSLDDAEKVFVMWKAVLRLASRLLGPYSPQTFGLFISISYFTTNCAYGRKTHCICKENNINNKNINCSIMWANAALCNWLCLVAGCVQESVGCRWFVVPVGCLLQLNQASVRVFACLHHVCVRQVMKYVTSSDWKSTHVHNWLCFLL